MLKILLFQQYYFPEMTGGARRAKELSEQFVKDGHSVTVFTSFPRDFRSMPGFEAKNYELLNKVLVIRKNTIFNVGKNTVFRMFSYLMYVINSFFYLMKNKKNYDMVISMAPLPSAIAPALVKKIFNIYHHFDVPDILPDLGISAGMIKNKLVINFLFKIEKWVYDNCNSISPITKGQINNIISKGVPSKKLSYIPDWIDDTFFKENLSIYKNEISKKIKNSRDKLISFVGNIGALQNPEIFLHVMKLLSEEGHHNYKFLFIGDGIMLPFLKEKSKELKLNNVEFIGRVKREYVPAYMNLSDLLVANYLPNKYMDICIPGKLFEYAISKKPILMGARGEAADLIKKYNLGCAVKPSDEHSFKDAIIRIFDDSYSFKPETNKFVDDFSLPTVIKNYNKIFEGINNQ